MELELSPSGRPIFWLAEVSWYGGTVRFACPFSTRAEAIKYASLNAERYVDWSVFPAKGRKYPHDDRDGSDPQLNPVWCVSWTQEGGGWARVTEMEICEKFNWYARYALLPTIPEWKDAPTLP